MKQYTTTEQTAKLIELGFEKPRALVDKYYDFDAETYAEVKAYSISELIEMLPKIIETEIWWGDEKGKIGVWGLRIDTEGVEYMWTITYERDNSANLGVVGAGEELIDALYDMIVKLKEEEVI
jgi:hypothetical protein